MPYKVFTRDRVLIYILPLVIFTALVGKAIAHGPKQFTVPAILVFSLTWFAWAAIASFVFVLRWRFKKSISFVTKQGTSVILGKRSDAETWCVLPIENKLQEVINFWVYHKLHDDSSLLDKRFSAAFIIFTDKPIVQHGNPMYGIVTRKVKGLTFGNHMGIYWPPEAIFPEILALVRHEAGHVVVNMLHPKLTQDEQHRLMDQVGFGQ